MYCALDKTLSYISNKSGSYCTFVVVARREKRKNTWCKRQRCVSTKQCLSVGRYMRYLAKKCPFQCANDCHMPSRRFYMITKRHIIVGRISNFQLCFHFNHFKYQSKFFIKCSYGIMISRIQLRANFHWFISPRSTQTQCFSINLQYF